MTTDIVEYLRNKMVNAADRTGTFTHPEVVQISQRLDKYIAEVQRQRARGLWLNQLFSEDLLEVKHRPRHARISRVRTTHLRYLSIRKVNLYRKQILH